MTSHFRRPLLLYLLLHATLKLYIIILYAYNIHHLIVVSVIAIHIIIIMYIRKVLRWWGFMRGGVVKKIIWRTPNAEIAPLSVDAYCTCAARVQYRRDPKTLGLCKTPSVYIRRTYTHRMCGRVSGVGDAHTCRCLHKALFSRLSHKLICAGVRDVSSSTTIQYNGRTARRRRHYYTRGTAY